MKQPNFKYTVVAAGIALALSATAAQASHFRGAAMIPSVNANGLLTVTTTSFWRNGAADGVSANVAGAAFVGSSAQVFDTSDSRFTKVTDVVQYQLPSSGTFSITGSSCCRVSGIQNWPGGNSSTSWTMNSAIAWNGSSANTPILFNFSSVQPEVVRNTNYTGNLSAVAGSGLTLTYDQILNGIPSQPPGFTVNTTTGALFIPAASTAGYADNPSNPGADYAFSGNIKASDGSFVEFDWLFDAVNTGSNLAPTVNDVIINALVGSTVNTTITGVDDGLPTPPGALSWVDLGLLTPLGTCANAPTFNTATQAFVWDTTGCAVGPYIYQVQASDSLLTDVGSITVNLSNQGPTVPEPATLALLGLGALGMGAFTRRRKS